MERFNLSRMLLGMPLCGMMDTTWYFHTMRQQSSAATKATKKAPKGQDDSGR